MRAKCVHNYSADIICGECEGQNRQFVYPQVSAADISDTLHLLDVLVSMSKSYARGEIIGDELHREVLSRVRLYVTETGLHSPTFN